MSAQEISVIRDQWLGEGHVAPAVPATDSEFVRCEPAADGSFSAADLVYTITYRHVLATDEDLADPTNMSRHQGAHNRTLLIAHLMVEQARRQSTVDAAGQRVPLGIHDVSDPLFYEGKELYLDTTSLRTEVARTCHAWGQHVLCWIGQPPVISAPTHSRLLWPTPNR